MTTPASLFTADYEQYKTTKNSKMKTALLSPTAS